MISAGSKQRRTLVDYRVKNEDEVDESQK